MTASDTRQAMERYFEVLGSDHFGDAVTADVTWTVVDTEEVVDGVSKVAQHLEVLHAAMLGTRTRDLVVGESAAVLEGDAAALADPSKRIAFCVVYDVREGLVTAMRVYGGIEVAVAKGS